MAQQRSIEALLVPQHGQRFSCCRAPQRILRQAKTIDRLVGQHDPLDASAAQDFIVEGVHRRTERLLRSEIPRPPGIFPGKCITQRSQCPRRESVGRQCKGAQIREKADSRSPQTVRPAAVATFEQAKGLCDNEAVRPSYLLHPGKGIALHPQQTTSIGIPCRITHRQHLHGTLQGDALARLHAQRAAAHDEPRTGCLVQGNRSLRQTIKHVGCIGIDRDEYAALLPADPEP